jgi:AcrR family transcriptional regulator
MAPRSVDKEEKALLLIHHATLVFAENGYAATTIDAVAERAGVAKGTIYRYFKGKQELFFAVFDNYMEQYFSALRDQVPGREVSAEKQLREATRKAFELAEAIDELFPLIFEFWAASASSEMRDRFKGLFRILYATFRKFFGEIIRRGIDEGDFDPGLDVESVTAVLVGSMDGLFLQAWFDKNMSPLRAGNAFMDVFIRGLKKHEIKVRHGGSGA